MRRTTATSPKREAAYYVHACGRKLGFPTREAAQAENKGQRAYVCTVCGKWHLTGDRKYRRKA